MLQRLLIFLIVLPGIAAGFAPEWNWFKATSIKGGWVTATGKAEVVIKGREVTATLYWEDSGTEVRFTLKGTISGSKVTVRETIHNSDAGSSTYSGRRLVGKWPEFDGTVGLDSITLFDGFSMIGISKDVTR